MKKFETISESELCCLAISALSDKMSSLMNIASDCIDRYGSVPADLQADIDIVNSQHAELTRRYIQIISKRV